MNTLTISKQIKKAAVSPAQISHTHRGVEYDTRCVESKSLTAPSAIVVKPTLSETWKHYKSLGSYPWECGVSIFTIRRTTSS